MAKIVTLEVLDEVVSRLKSMIENKCNRTILVDSLPTDKSSVMQDKVYIVQNDGLYDYYVPSVSDGVLTWRKAGTMDFAFVF